MRNLGCLLCVLVASVFGQSGPAPKFEMADVHTSPPARSTNLRAYARDGRDELRMATMVDLVRLAYNVDADRVLEGPSWLEMDRFDVIALGPPKVTVETRRAMLQALLQDRFQLAVHKDTRPLDAWVLTADKRVSMKKAATAGPGCKFVPPGPPGPDGPPLLLNECRGVTMSAFADALRNMPGTGQYLNGLGVADKTGLDGAWDFDVRYNLRGFDGGDRVTLAAGLQKLGLKLESARVALPVIVVA